MTGRPIYLLIIDDDAGDRMQIRRALAKSGLAYELVETADMEEALAACEGRQFDAVVVDYHMPGLDGLGGISRLRETRPLLPVIMSTGQGCEQIAAAAIKLGALDYLPKANIDEHTIRRVLEGAVERASLNRKVAEQQEALENFARILVHDLKSPISTILGFTTLNEVELQKENFDRERALEGSRRVARAARNMLTIIETLRQYTRLDSQVEFGAVPMKSVMEDVLMALEQVITERGAAVTHDDLPVVRGNAPQLTQLLLNLIGNAIKYCEAAPPTVRITTQKQPEGNWLFEVRDNGIGVPEKERDKVFDPFKRLHASSRYEGTGLGLAICKKIIERHDGTIWVKSKEGEGTSFFFTLPDATARPQAEPGAAQQRKSA
jgi:signal transduction histidine kinase